MVLEKCKYIVLIRFGASRSLSFEFVCFNWCSTSQSTANGHVGTLPPFYGTLPKIRTS